MMKIVVICSRSKIESRINGKSPTKTTLTTKPIFCIFSTTQQWSRPLQFVFLLFTISVIIITSFTNSTQKKPQISKIITIITRMTVIKLNGKVWDIRLSVNFQIRRHHRNVENVTHIILIPETTLPLLTQTSSLMHLRSANHHPRNASKKVIISYLFYPITIMLSILTAFTTTTLLMLGDDDYISDQKLLVLFG